MIVAYVPDLMDRSKVQAASAGQDVRFVATAAELPSAARGARLVVVDLGRPGVLDALAALAEVQVEGAVAVEVIGFGSHVDRALLEAARAVGGTTVLARSEFFRRTAELLGGPAGSGA